MALSERPMTKSIHILNGPNLNLLGTRQPEIYGHDTLAHVEEMCRAEAEGHGIGIVQRQSNHEGMIIDWIQEARDAADGIIINPGALTHYSIAVLDALNAFDGPVIELHVSQVHKRESFRHRSYVSQRADAVMAGFGVAGYSLATRHMITLITAG